MPLNSGRLLAAVIATHPEIMLRYDRISMAYGGNHSVTELNRVFLRYRTVAEQMQGEHPDMVQEIFHEIERRAQRVREETLRTAGRQVSVNQSPANRHVQPARTLSNPIHRSGPPAGDVLPKRAERTLPPYSSIAQDPSAHRADPTHILTSPLQWNSSSAYQPINADNECTATGLSPISNITAACRTGANSTLIDLTEGDTSARQAICNENEHGVGQIPFTAQTTIARELVNTTRHNDSSERNDVANDNEMIVAESSLTRFVTISMDAYPMSEMETRQHEQMALDSFVPGGEIAGQPANNNTSAIVGSQASTAIEIIDLVSDSSSESGSSSSVFQQSIAVSSPVSARGITLQFPSPFSGIQGPLVHETGVQITSVDEFFADPALLDPMVEVFRDFDRTIQDEDERMEEQDVF